MPDFKHPNHTPIRAALAPTQPQKVRPNSTQSIVIREPVAMDAIWILRLYEYAMDEGHYAPQESERIFVVIRQMIHMGIMKRQVDRDNKTFVESIKVWFRVAEINGHPAGFLLNAEREPGSQEIEVYQMGTRQQFMRRGVAQALLDDTLSTYAGRPFFARCYPRSNEAVSLLVKKGFKVSHITPKGTRELKR